MELPPQGSVVCVDNTVVFKAVYNPESIVTDLFEELILRRSCSLHSTERNLRRCQEAVERKLLSLCEKLLAERDPNIEHLKRYSLVLDAFDIALKRIRRGRKSTVDRSRLAKVFTQELIEQVKAFVSQRLDFVKSFVNIHSFQSYSFKLDEALSILKDPETDQEDAHLLALALALHEKLNSPIFLWTHDSDFYNVDDVLKGYSIHLFKRVR